MPLLTTGLGDVVLLPFPAYAPMTERYEWLTDVFDSHNGTESRLALRQAPRTSLRYAFAAGGGGGLGGGARAAANALRGGLRRRWAVPLWAHAQAAGSVAGGATEIPCVTAGRDFRVGGLALLYKSETAYQLFDVEDVAADSITVSPVAVAINGAFVVPVRTGYVDGKGLRKSNGFDATHELTFELEDNLETDNEAPAQFLSQDIYTSEVLKAADRYDIQWFTEVNKADYELGPVDRRSPWTYPRAGYSYHYVLEGFDEVHAFRQFLARRAGKYRKFWQPTFEHDLQPVGSGAVGTTFVFQDNDNLDLASDRTHVAFQDAAGTWYPRVLSGIAPSGGAVTSTLNSSLPLTYSAIRCVSFLNQKRLASDTVELEWVGNSAVVCDLGILELAP